MKALDQFKLSGLHVESIVFERGLILRQEGNLWGTHGGSRTGPVCVVPNQVSKNLRPVLIRMSPQGGGPLLTVILDTEGRPVPRLGAFALFEGISMMLPQFTI